MADTGFDLERSRAYWRHAPSGSGKFDTTTLSNADDRIAEETWDQGFRGRFLNYPEEEQFLRTLSRRLAGRRMLSIGSGLGFHELYYAAAGAEVTCADIVDSNIEAIRRVAALKGITSISGRVLETGDVSGLGTDFDVVFLYGSLMAMPGDRQRVLLDALRRMLSPSGTLILMLYSWEFVRRTCGWTSPADFDPPTFARFSDPTVGAEDCPWSDWHDDDKLLSLAPGMSVLHMQTWNDGQYLWYELSQEAVRQSSPFFAPGELTAGRVVSRVPMRRFEAADATLRHGWRGTVVETGVNQSSYAAIASADARAGQPNALTMSLEVTRGACAVGILDDDRNQFVASTVVALPGRQEVLLLAPQWPRRGRIVISNHQVPSAQSSCFTIRHATLLHRSIAEPPRAVAR
jgi:SAM-dependent methyltransferase